MYRSIYAQYWTGAAVLAALVMIVPIWLVFDDKPLEAALVGCPMVILLGIFITATIGWLRKED